MSNYKINSWIKFPYNDLLSWSAKEKSIHLFLLLFLAAAFLLSCNGNIPYKLIETQIESTSVPGFSDLPSNTRTIYVIVPQNYDEPENTSKRYPSVYILHGAGMGRRDVKNMAKLIKDILNNMGNQIGEMIVAIPLSGSNLCGDPSQYECSSFYANSEINGNFQDYILSDVIEFLDSNYRTLPDAAHRAITGFSMGGYGAMILAMKSAVEMGTNCPFSSIACHSGILSFRQAKDDFAELVLDPHPSIGESLVQWYMFNIMIPAIERAFCPYQTLYFHVENGEFKYNEVLFESLLDEFDPLEYLSNHNDALEGMKVYFDCGKHDELGFLKHAQQFREKLIALGYSEGTDFRYEEWESGEEWGLDLPDWFSGHSLITLRAGESFKFHWGNFGT